MSNRDRSRDRSPHFLAGPRGEVEAFIAENDLDTRAAAALREQSKEVQDQFTRLHKGG